MPDREKVIKGLRDIVGFIADSLPLEQAKIYLRTIDETIALLKEQEHKDRMYHALEDDWKRLKELLKEQEESIPVSWLTEKLEGHSELPYAVTDGINNVLDLWEGR